MAPKVKVVTATGQTQKSTVTGDLDFPHIPLGFPIKGHLMSGFRYTLIGLDPLCDADCTVAFTRKSVIVQEKYGTPLLTCWREATGSRLWIIALQTGESNLPSMPNYANLDRLAAYSAYDLTRVAALIRNFHAEAGYPVRYTWLKAISYGN